MGKLLKLFVQVLGIILVLTLTPHPGLAKEKPVKQDISAKVAKEKSAKEKVVKGKTVRGKIVRGEIVEEECPGKKVKAPGKAADKSGLLTTAKKYLGTPYRFGGTTPQGFDCSGYVMYVFDKHGQKLPRDAASQFKAGTKIPQTKLQKGDLVFFTTYEKGASHVGIYFGENSFIHASTSKGVMLSKLDDPYWKPRYIGARRV